MAVEAAAEDAGADATVVPESVIKKMMLGGFDEERGSLRTPMIFKLAVVHGPEIRCQEKVLVKRLTCMVRGVRAVFQNTSLLVSVDIDELLIGRDVLNKVALSFGEYLVKNADDLNGLDLPHTKTEIAPTEGSICRLAAFGGAERLEDEANVGDVGGTVYRMKPGQMPDLPPLSLGDPLEEEDPEIEI
jgi:hypothetical protein